MRKLEKELHNKAMEMDISREVLSFAKDNDANMYRFLVDIYEDGVKGVKTFLYLPATLSEPDSVRVMTAAMVEYYCGGDYDGTLEALIAEASGKEEETKNVEAPAEEEKEEKPKRTRRTKAKKSDEKPASKEEEKEDKPKEEPKKEPKTKSKAKNKTIAYDRNQTEHKKELAKVLNFNFPGWAEDKTLIAKAKEVSEQLVGVALFDSKGEVMDTFAQNVIELMGEGNEEESNDVDL